MRYFFVIFIFSAVVSCKLNPYPYVQGRNLYVAHCQNCHMEDGKGLNKLIPSLPGSQWMGNADMVCIIKNGMMDTLWNGNDFMVKEMPSFSGLSPTEVANIVNFVNYEWNPGFKEFSIKEIQESLNQCK